MRFALGLVGKEVSYRVGEGLVFDLTEQAASATYDPGYLVLGEHLIVATTEDSLKSIASVSGGDGSSLAGEAEYSRLVAGTSGTTSPLPYIDIRGLTDAMVASLDAADRREYEENVEPFTRPLKTLLASGDTQEGISRPSITVTIE